MAQRVLWQRTGLLDCPEQRQGKVAGNAKDGACAMVSQRRQQAISQRWGRSGAWGVGRGRFEKSHKHIQLSLLWRRLLELRSRRSHCVSHLLPLGLSVEAVASCRRRWDEGDC